MERGHPTQYPTQVCLFVEILGLLHYMRLSVQQNVGLYIAFINNGGVLRKQIRGIPMGTNCGPLLANLYLYAYESSFIDRLQSLSELGKETARSFHMTFRLIDDVFSVGNPVIHQYVHQPARRENDGKTGIGGLYPHELQLNDTNVSDTEVHFLGMTISNLDGSLELDIFDKKKAFPFRVIRYPHMIVFMIVLFLPVSLMGCGLDYSIADIVSAPNRKCL